MKKFVCLFLVFLTLSLKANSLFPENPYAPYFEKAYSLHPKIPKGMLEAVSFTQSRFQHLTTENNSCIGYPKTHGVFGLIEDGKNYFRNNLPYIAELSSYPQSDIRNNAETHILAYAAAFSHLQKKYQAYGNNLKQYLPVLTELSELPLSQDLQNDFALNTHLYQIFWFLGEPNAAQQYQFPLYTIDFYDVFGENYKVLSSSGIRITDENHISNGKNLYNISNLSSLLSPDYPPALWNPAASCNYSSRNGIQISAVAIHFVQGSYAGCISWFKNCSASASAHYVLRSSDGQVTQMVLEADKAWHVGSENPYTVGLEHEGYINNISWFTDAMYNSSSALTKDICMDNNINPLRTYYGPSCSGSSPQCQLGNCTKVKGHQHYANQTHTDPGPNWNWSRYYKLINNTYSVTTYTALGGNFYDSGGPTGNYANDERKFWLFTNPSASNINLNFTAFNTEVNYDFLFLYNGGNHHSPLIAQYSGTIIPAPVLVSNDSLLVEFRSDCGVVAPGWIASYSISTAASSATDNIAPTTVINTNNPWKTNNFTATVVDQDNPGGSGVAQGYYQVLDFNGNEWRGNYERGFLFDNFDNLIHTEWTQKTGSWSIDGNALVQSDESGPQAGNTNIYAALSQTLSNKYLYHFYAKFEGSGNNRRGGFHFFCDNADSSNRNNSYFVWFRLDDQKIQIYKVNNNTFGAPVLDLPLAFNASQWYDVKVIYDRISGNMKVYLNNVEVAQWTDSNPISQGNYVSFRSGNCKMSIDEIRIYRSRNMLVNITVGANNDIRYQNNNPVQYAGKINSVCQDSAGNISAVIDHFVNVDWTAPYNILFVNDGHGPDIQVVNTTNSLTANWAPSGDPHSGIVRYWYSIGTVPGGTNTLGWTSNWASTTVTAQNLTLTQNTVYYFNIMAENGAGLFSPIVSSNGQKVDSTYVIGLEEKMGERAFFTIHPNPAQEEIELNIQNPAHKPCRLQIRNKLGQLLMEEEIPHLNTKHQTKIDLPNGLYFVHLIIEEKRYSKKLVVQKE